MAKSVLPQCPSLSTTKFCSPLIYSELLTEKRKSVTGSDCIRQVSDVYLLLNQDRLDKQTLEVITDRINKSMNSNSLSELRNNLDAKDLAKYVKDRHIQSQSELHDYMCRLMAYEKSYKEEKAYSDKLKKQEEEARKAEEEAKKANQSKTD